MKKALMVATVGGFFRFELNDIKILKGMGYEVHCASNFVGDQKSAGVKGLNDMGDVKLHQIDFARSPFSSNTLKAYKQLKRLLSEEKFELIHCHTPVGGILTRLAARKYRKHGTKVFYTAHGFHFFEGAPLANWLLFYPVEWICSWWTDVLLTINQEDYKRANNKFHAKKTVYIPGVGIDLEKFRSGNVDRVKKRKELGLKKTDKMLLSVGELSKRKNHELVLKALAEIKNPNIKYFICGNGSLANELQHLTETLNITEQVKFLGYRNDISELCQSADLYVFPSLQEGLPVALMEAIACKTPVICSKIRGSTDLVKDSDYLFHTNEATELASCIEKALSQDNTSAVEENYNTLLAYDLTNVAVHMNEHYKGIFEVGGVMRLYRKQCFMQQYGISHNEHILLSVGELNKNKNHEVVIRAIAKLNNPAIHYCIAGKGDLKDYLENLAEELGVSKQIHLLGYRTDVVELLQMADGFCFPSKREGLGLAAIEAMACGLPLITSNIHGIKDYSQNGITGYSCKPNDIDGFSQAIHTLISSKETQEEMKLYNQEFVKRFSIEVVGEQMKKLYAEHLCSYGVK